MKKILTEALQFTFLWYLCASGTGMSYILCRFVIYDVKVIGVTALNLLQFLAFGVLPATYLYVSALKNEKKKQLKFEQKLNSVTTSI